MNSSAILGVADEQMRCPLSGAAKAVMMIDGATMIVIGTEECTYYTKTTLSMRGGGAKCHSLVLNNHDVTFGCSEKVAKAIDSVIAESNPKSLFLITTCVVEITGDDYTSVALDAEEKYNIPVKVIQTCHFKGKNGEHGMELVRKTAVPFARMPSKGTMMIERLKMKMTGHKKSKSEASTPSDMPPMNYRMGLLHTLVSTPNVIVLEYGTAGTTAYAIKTLQMTHGIDCSKSLFTTGMSENEIVMGDTTRLENALKTLDKTYSPKVIFVLSTAVSEVTGVDVKGVCHYMQDELRAKLIPCTGHGYGGNFVEGVEAAIKLKGNV
ncbi:MAG: nitrogenase component 1 [Rikenellaceae bacterium]